MDYNSLKNMVAYHDKLYFDDAAPILTDAEYDSLYQQLVTMEDTQGWKDPDSPTVRIVGKGKIKHHFKLYSLKKVYEEQEVDSSFDIRMPKLDGANLSISYVNTALSTALTRGDGEVGESVLHIVPYIKGIPESIAENALTVFVGEVVTDNTQVENFRNYVAGALGLKDAQEAKGRNLRFIVHDVLGLALDYLDRLAFAKANGFDTVADSNFSQYPQDGIVFRVNSYEVEKELGYTSKYPRFAVALKQKESFSAVTYLKNIEWAVGRSGVVTPVGIVEPVVLDSATVSRVILHNIEFIEQHSLRRGDKILIERRITPQFVRVLEHSKYAPFTIDDVTSSLGIEVFRKGPKLFVSEADNFRYIEYFAKTLGIKGLGEATIKKLNINHPIDLYSIKDWSFLGKNGEKIAEELYRPKDYATVLAALGIPGVGKSTAQLIVSKIPKFEDLEKVSTLSIRNVGPTTVENIMSWLEVNKHWVKDLPYSLEAEAAPVSLAKRKIAITGKLDIKKADLAAHLERYGFELANSVTKDCYALITGGEESIKTANATKYGVPVLNYWKAKEQIMKGDF